MRSRHATGLNTDDRRGDSYSVIVIVIHVLNEESHKNESNNRKKSSIWGKNTIFVTG